jgi:PEGA domain
VPPAFFPSRRDGLIRPAVLLLVVLLSWLPPARAQDQSDPQAKAPDAERKSRASAHLVKGAQLIDAEDLQGALAQFEAAYRLVPSPVIQHNFGIVYQGLGRKAEALNAFERFLAEAPKAPPAARAHAERAVAELQPQVAALLVRADLDGASIFVDGRNLGQTPHPAPLYLDPGPHHLSVERADVGALFAERVELSAGQRLTVQARLTRPPPPLPEPALGSAPAPPAPEATFDQWRRPAAWAAAVGAALATGLLVQQVVARNREIERFNAAGCGELDPNNGGKDCQAWLGRARSARNMAIGSGLLAGALGIGSVVLFVTLPEHEDALGLGLRGSGSHLGFGLQGRF